MQSYINTINRTPLIFALILIFNACTTLGPDFDTPKADVAGEWIDIKDPILKSDSDDYSEWWRVFNDPILDSLINSAYQQNLTLQVAGLRVLEARAQLGIAVGNLYPQSQQARGGANYNKRSKHSANSIQGDLNYWDFDEGFDIAWELDFWGKFRRAIESADADMLANMADYDDFLVSLLAEVANVYTVIRTFENRIQLAKENVDLQKRSLRITEVRFQNGATTELDVQQAKTLLRNTQATIPQLKVGDRQARHALSILIGKPPSELNEILTSRIQIPNAPSEVAIGIPAELLRRRPDIRRAEFETASQSALIGVAKADLYPSFSLTGSLGLKASAGTNTTRTGEDGVDELFESDSLEFFGGPSFTWNIFNYGRIKNQVRVQDARFQQLVVNYQDTVLRAAREVEDAIVGFLNAQEAEIYLSESVDAASRSVELALIQYRDGVENYQRVIDTQTSLVSQQDAWTQTRGDIATNLIAMYRALGGGWQIGQGNDYVSDEIKDRMRKRTDWGKILAK